jgi:hypothetical protein
MVDLFSHSHQKTKATINKNCVSLQPEKKTKRKRRKKTVWEVSARQALEGDSMVKESKVAVKEEEDHTGLCGVKANLVDHERWEEEEEQPKREGARRLFFSSDISEWFFWNQNQK